MIQRCECPTLLETRRQLFTCSVLLQKLLLTRSYSGIFLYVWCFSPFQCRRNQSLLQNDCCLHVSLLLASCEFLPQHWILSVPSIPYFRGLLFLCLLLNPLSTWQITCSLTSFFHTLFLSAWLTLIVKLLGTFCEECLIKGQCWHVDFITVAIFIFLSRHTFYC